MNRLISYALSLVLIFAITTAAQAYVGWSVAGWYVVEDDPGGLQLYQGPFADEATCLANKPPEEEWAIFECKYFAEKPSGDQWY